MRVFGIAGHSGRGKTTLLERLVPELSSRGLVVSLIMHSHKNIDIDRPGKDSYRLRESGCKEVLLLGNDRWALMNELRGAGIEPYAWVLNKSVLAAGTSDPLLAARLAGECKQVKRMSAGMAKRIFTLPWLTRPPIGIVELSKLVRDPRRRRTCAE